MRTKSFITFIGVVLLGSICRGDVTVARALKSSGVGGFGSFEGSETLSIKGPRSRNESKLKFKGVVGVFAKPGDTVTLTLLDKSLVQTLNVSKKTYRERSLKDLPQTMKRPQAAPGKKEEKGKEAPPTHRVTKSSLKVTPTGQAKTIGGFPCREFQLEALLEMENIQTKEKTETRMVDTLWTTPETNDLRKLKSEEQAFWAAYAKEIGMSFSPRDADNWGSALAASLTGAGEKDLQKTLQNAAAETKKIKGYPIVSQVDWYVKSEEGKAPPSEKPAQSEDGGVDTSGGLKGALGGFAKKMAAKQVEKKMEERRKANENAPAISIYSELKSVSTQSVPEASFEIPAGFKKVEDKN